MAARGLPSRKLLLVDDDRLVLATLSSGLAEAGFEVFTAESAEEAEALLAEGVRPSIAVVDVRMPGQGGLYLAQRLNQLDHVPFIILSAYSDSKIVDEATRCGAMGYAVKPTDIHQLVPAIEAALTRAHDLKDLRETREQLQKALDAERDISVATGICMVRDGIARRDAFAALRNAARNQRRKLADVAAEVIAQHDTAAARNP